MRAKSLLDRLEVINRYFDQTWKEFDTIIENVKRWKYVASPIHVLGLAVFIRSNKNNSGLKSWCENQIS